jgi:2-oxoglutarate dehydrogenase E2 component (dihydrolipoamide succinyltransferase)
MLIDVTMPQLGESVSEGTVAKWRVREGDVVKKDDPLVEIATDKADSELPAPHGGKVVRIVAPEGAVVAVKGVLCQIDDAAAASAEEKVADGASRTLASPTVRREALERDVDLRDVKGSGERGRITREDVARASSVATPEAPAPLAPTPPPKRSPSPAAASLAEAINQGGGFVPPIPGVGYGSFKVPVYRPHDGDQVVPFTRRRRITADHMTYSKVVSPHVVTVAEVDLHKTSKLRDAHKDRYKKDGHPLTMLAFVAVATARALRENPSLNARVIEDAFVLLKDIHLGIAVDSPDGLVVPVIRRADELGVRGIVRAIDDLATRARTGKITIDDLSGASFSVTNPGLKGNLFGGAIINQPNAGILRMGEIQKRVVVVEGPDGEDTMAIHPVMYIALSYDHRIVDGVAANSFLFRVSYSKRATSRSDYLTITIVCSLRATSAPSSVHSSRASVT